MHHSITIRNNPQTSSARGQKARYCLQKWPSSPWDISEILLIVATKCVYSLSPSHTNTHTMYTRTKYILYFVGLLSGVMQTKNLTHCQQECRMVQQLWKTAWEFPQNVQNSYHVTQKFHF
jgi:hypothetical protein